MRDDLGTGKKLVAVDVIAVMVRVDHVAKRLVRHLRMASTNAFAHRRGGRVDDHQPLVADDDTGVGDADAVAARAAACV